jgi:hypothetical protein
LEEEEEQRNEREAIVIIIKAEERARFSQDIHQPLTKVELYYIAVSHIHLLHCEY